MNGNGADSLYLPSMPVLSYAPSSFSRTQIVEAVNQHETDMTALYERMNGDYERYRLTPHVNTDPVTGEELSNYAIFTSNAPKVFADKVISWQNLAELLLRVPHLEAGQHQEETDNLKERFIIGCLRAADERLKRMLLPSLRGQQAFFTTVRGGYIGGRCMLVKDMTTGKTYPDITAFDPMHLHFCVGADGLEWVCNKIKKTRAQIRREYGIDVESPTGAQERYIRGSSDAEAEGIYVYDFYDGQMNTVVTNGETLKQPVPHGSPRVPCYAVLVGPQPMLQSETASGLAGEVGESVYAPVRETYDKKNALLSIFQELVERSRDQTTITESEDGKKTLPDDPFKKGTSISTRRGDKIYTLEMQKMAADAMAYVTLVLGEEQRATLPYSAYGETPFQLSGFAITQLRQATETVLASRIEALSSMYLQIANLLYDQFMTGAFDGMQLSGKDSSRNYFNQTITPAQLQNTCDYTVSLVSQLPQDDMSKWSMAEIAKKLGLMGDVDILDNIVGVQDAQQTIDKVRSQKAEEGLPEAQLYTMMMAAANRGEKEIAQMYLAEFQRLMAVKLGIVPDMAPGQGGAKGQSAPPKGGGQRPEVMPNAQMGAPPSPETSNNGPSFVAPNTPRPGAQGQNA